MIRCLAALLLLVGCDTVDDGENPPSDGGACADRTGGALIEFDIAGEGLVVWITDDTFIDMAIDREGQQAYGVVEFSSLVAGTDCDERYGWHVAPDQAAFFDAAVEVCDGRPSDIESDPTYWIETLGYYCPWSAQVVAVTDQR